MNAGFWINKLGLKSHPEGGFYREVYRSEEVMENGKLPKRYSGERNFSTSIYFLLNKEQISTFHKLKSDEIWHFYTGSPLKIHIITQDGIYKVMKLGIDLSNGENLQIVIPHNNWFAAELLDKSSFSLIGCTVSPGFDFNDFIIGKRKYLTQLFPQHKDLIERLTNN